MGKLAPFGFLFSGFLLLISANEPLVPALYIFGDSTVDAGNNNVLETLLKANFPPYGKDFPGGVATGRFTNGKLASDIISGFLGLPDVLPAYLDHNFQGQKLLTGCSFASAGAGIDDTSSNAVGVLTLEKEWDYFKSYRGKLESMVGKDGASKIISEALFGLSMGTNDFIENYYINPEKRAQYNISQFQDHLLEDLKPFIENLHNEGATKFYVTGLFPFGCVPLEITYHGGCVEEYNEVAASFNDKLRAFIDSMKPTVPNLQILYVDVYDKLTDLVKNPTKYGFEVASRGCCGTGLTEIGPTCNSFCTLCRDASKYVFWDSVHPTSATYSIVAKDTFQKLKTLIKF